MYGAVPYVMKTFGVDRLTAFSVVCEWLDRQLESAPTQDAAGKRKGNISKALR